MNWELLKLCIMQYWDRGYKVVGYFKGEYILLVNQETGYRARLGVVEPTALEYLPSISHDLGK